VTYRHVLGVDLSSTRTGICASGEVHSFTPTGSSLLDRAQQTSHEVAGWAMSADLIVIEAIGTRQVQTAIALAYVHALVEDRCAGENIVKVAPADLKKFAVGKGNADKDSVMLAAARHEPAIGNNDEADAWWLWVIGEWLAGRPFIETDYRRKVIDKIRAKEASRE